MATTITEPAVLQQSSGKPTTRDFRQEVTDSILRMLENGVAPWQKPWEPGRNPLGIPMNPTSGRPYRGGNAIHLMATALRKGYEDPRWMTYKQASEGGWQVRRGEKGTQIEFWELKAGNREERTTGASENGGGRDTERERDRGTRLIHRVYTVFNASQIEGVPPYKPKEHTAFEVIRSGEQIMKNSGAEIRHDQVDRAFYSRSSDTIHLPPKEAFKDAPGYYGTALHELAHWTGHPSRLNRSTLTESYRFGDTNYAREELRAELASLFLAAERGIPHTPEQHAAYVGSWIAALKRDKNEIFRAAHDASAASDFLLTLARDRAIAEQALTGGPVFDSTSSGSSPAAVFEQETATLERDREDLDERVPDGVVPPAEGPKSADYVYSYAVKAGQDQWKWKRDGTLIWATANSEREAIEQIQTDAANNGVSPRIKDASLFRPTQASTSDHSASNGELRESTQYASRFEPGSATVNVENKATGTDRRVAVDPLQIRDSDSQGELNPVSESAKSKSAFDALNTARDVSKQTLGDSANVLAAHTDSGTYRGPIIGCTEHHVIQKQSGRSASAHPRELLDRQPEVGQTVRINYSNDRGSVREVRERPKVKEVSR
ncbi:MAG: ArdC family protein [Bryobacteraceae bacterium]